MNYLAANLAVIKEHRPYLYKCLQPYLERSDYQLVTTAPSQFDIVFPGADGQMRSLYKQSPEALYQQGLANLSMPRARLIVFDGIGLGMHVRTYLKARGDEVKELLLVEKDPGIFLQALKHSDWTDLLLRGEVEIFVGLPENHMAAAALEFFKARSRVIYSYSMAHFFFMPALETAGAYYVGFAKILADAAQRARMLFDSPAKDTYWGYLNILRNLGWMAKAPHLEEFKGIFKGKPAIIVAAGPSLDFHLKYLGAVQNQFFIIATDGALGALVKHGIKPHFIVTIERVKFVKSLFDQLPPNYNVPCATLPVRHPDVMRADVPLVMASRVATFGKWLYPERTQLFFGLHVGAMSFAISHFFGCSEIYLVGQDLAYDPTTRATHFADQIDFISYSESVHQETDLFLEVPGNDGKPVPTSLFWDLFRKDTEYLIATTGLRCVNVIPKHKGAKIAYAEHMEPEEFYRTVKGEPADYQGLIAKVLAQPRREKNWHETMQRTHQYLAAIEEQGLACLHDMRDAEREAEFRLVDEASADKIIDGWRANLEKILAYDREQYSSFFSNFFISTHIRSFLQLEEVRQHPDYKKRFVTMTMIMRTWVKELLFWAEQARFGLDECLKREEGARAS